MNVKEELKVRVEWNNTNNKWTLELPGDGRQIELDSAVVDITEADAKSVTGYIVVSHGIPQEQVANMQGSQLRALGLGVYSRSLGIPVKNGRNRVQLTSEGKVENY